MKARLVFVPPDGGEADYSLEFELPGVPQPGDYISVTRPWEEGTADFMVRRSWWYLNYPDNALHAWDDSPPVYGTLERLLVECEFAKGPYSAPSHKKACEGYKEAKEFEDTAF